MSWKRGWVLLVFFIVILCYSVNADQGGCNLDGGIYCSNAVCVKSGEYVHTCQVSQTQEVKTQNAGLNQYNFQTLQIDAGIYLSFSFNGEITTSYTGAGGSKGAGGSNCGSNGCGDGPYGKDGGKGGDLGKKGTDGIDEEHSSSGNGVASSFVGGNILLVSEIFGNNGFISVNGFFGTGGWCNYDDIGDVGKAGPGGAGGSGAGVLNIVSKSYTGTGNFQAKGGAGGKGGKGSDDDGHCGVSTTADGGGGGGGGGGGAGGHIAFYAPTGYVTSLQTQIQTANPTISCSGGNEGAGGEPGGDEAGYGTSGTVGSNGVCSNAVKDSSLVLTSTGTELDGVLKTQGRLACFDNTDNDLDGFVDFEDRDCFETTAYFWTTANGPFAMPTGTNGIKKGDARAPLWWDPFSTTGRDGVCGDDTICLSKTNYTACSQISNPITCTAHSAYGCSLTLGEVGCSGETIGCNAFLQLTYSGLDDGCLPDAPADCISQPLPGGCDVGYGPEPCYSCVGTASCSDVPDYLCTSPCTLITAGYCEGETYCTEWCVNDQFDCPGSPGTCIGGWLLCSDISVEDECDYEPTCNWVLPSPGYVNCSGTLTNPIDCISLSKQECQNNPTYCLLASQNDLYYFDSSAKFFCSNDYDDSLEEPYITPNPPKKWSWWDAKENAFFIHKIIV